SGPKEKSRLRKDKYQTVREPRLGSLAAIRENPLTRRPPMKSALKYENLTPHMGSEVANVDLAAASDADRAAIRDLLHERLVLVFRDQKLTREQHKRVARIFGT